MNEEIKVLLKEHLALLEEKTKEAKSTQELIGFSEQIFKISSVLLSKNYN